MKRGVLIGILFLAALPLRAEWGLSNVVTKEIHRSTDTAEEVREAPVPGVKQGVQTGSYTKSMNYPYTIHLCSVQNMADASRQLEKMRSKLDMIFITKIDLGEPGIWYRLDCGAFPTIKEAVAKLQELKRAGLVEEGSFVGGTVAYTIEIGLFGTGQEARSKQGALSLKGVSSYIIRERDDLYRLVAGAYPDEKSAAPALADLKSLNFQPVVKKR